MRGGVLAAPPEHLGLTLDEGSDLYLRALEEKRRLFNISQTMPCLEKYVPYRLLWVKVIIRAAYDFALWKDSKDLKLRKYAADAEKWLFEESKLSNSFESICHLFDLDMVGIRRYARDLTREEVKKLEFRERQGRDFLLLALGDRRQSVLDGDDQ